MDNVMIYTKPNSEGKYEVYYTVFDEPKQYNSLENARLEASKYAKVNSVSVTEYYGD